MRESGLAIERNVFSEELSEFTPITHKALLFLSPNVLSKENKKLKLWLLSNL